MALYRFVHDNGFYQFRFYTNEEEDPVKCVTSGSVTRDDVPWLVSVVQDCCISVERGMEECSRAVGDRRETWDMFHILINMLKPFREFIGKFMYDHYLSVQEQHYNLRKKRDVRFSGTYKDEEMIEYTTSLLQQKHYNKAKEVAEKIPHVQSNMFGPFQVVSCLLQDVRCLLSGARNSDQKMLVYIHSPFYKTAIFYRPTFSYILRLSCYFDKQYQVGDWCNRMDKKEVDDIKKYLVDHFESLDKDLLQRYLITLEEIPASWNESDPHSPLRRYFNLRVATRDAVNTRTQRAKHIARTLKQMDLLVYREYLLNNHPDLLTHYLGTPDLVKEIAPEEALFRCQHGVGYDAFHAATPLEEFYALSGRPCFDASGKPANWSITEYETEHAFKILPYMIRLYAWMKYDGLPGTWMSHIEGHELQIVKAAHSMTEAQFKSFVHNTVEEKIRPLFKKYPHFLAFFDKMKE